MRALSLSLSGCLGRNTSSNTRADENRRNAKQTKQPAHVEFEVLKCCSSLP